MDGREALTAALAYQIDNLKYGEQDASQAGNHHEDGEDALLSGPSNETVHLIGTGLLITLDERRKVVALVDMVDQVHEGGVHGDLEDQGQDIGPPQASTFLTSVLVETAAVLAILEAVFPFSLIPVGHMQHHQE